METTQKTNRIAVFIDAENLVSEVGRTGTPLRLRPIIDRIREEGQIVSMKAYGDWSQRYLSEFRSNVVEMIQLSTSSYGKNTADIQLALDALEMTLQPASPDTVVIISGDRDFVPLVQKIRRYGKSVLGIGSTEDSTSMLLAEACDMFLFAEDILSAALGSSPAQAREAQTAKREPAVAAAVTARADSSAVPDVPYDKVNRKLRRAFVLLAKAISSCERQGQPASESVVGFRMRQIASTFYPGRYGFGTFRDFALAAEKAGYAKIAVKGGENGLVFDLSHHVAPELLREELAEYDYTSVESAVDSYRDIMKTYKRLELLPWLDRQKLVSRCWECLVDGPKTYDELIGELQLYAASNLSWVDERAVELIVRTLSIARCFVSDDGIPRFENTTCRVKPAVELAEALFLMNYTYLNGIKMSVPDVTFNVDAVAILLFDEVTDALRAEVKKLLERLGIDSEPAETAMGIALQKAGAGKESAGLESS